MKEIHEGKRTERLIHGSWRNVLLLRYGGSYWNDYRSAIGFRFCMNFLMRLGWAGDDVIWGVGDNLVN